MMTPKRISDVRSSGSRIGPGDVAVHVAKTVGSDEHVLCQCPNGQQSPENTRQFAAFLSAFR
jgi:hypothetical protein